MIGKFDSTLLIILHVKICPKTNNKHIIIYIDYVSYYVKP